MITLRYLLWECACTEVPASPSAWQPRWKRPQPNSVSRDWAMLLSHAQQWEFDVCSSLPWPRFTKDQHMQKTVLLGEIRGTESKGAHLAWAYRLASTVYSQPQRWQCGLFVQKQLQVRGRLGEAKVTQVPFVFLPKCWISPHISSCLAIDAIVT